MPGNFFHSFEIVCPPTRSISLLICTQGGFNELQVSTTMSASLNVNQIGGLDSSFMKVQETRSIIQNSFWQYKGIHTEHHNFRETWKISNHRSLIQLWFMINIYFIFNLLFASNIMMIENIEMAGQVFLSLFIHLLFSERTKNALSLLKSINCTTTWKGSIIVLIVLPRCLRSSPKVCANTTSYPQSTCTSWSVLMLFNWTWPEGTALLYLQTYFV